MGCPSISCLSLASQASPLISAPLTPQELLAGRLARLAAARHHQQPHQHAAHAPRVRRHAARHHARRPRAQLRPGGRHVVVHGAAGAGDKSEVSGGSRAQRQEAVQCSLRNATPVAPPALLPRSSQHPHLEFDTRRLLAVLPCRPLLPMPAAAAPWGVAAEMGVALMTTPAAVPAGFFLRANMAPAASRLSTSSHTQVPCPLAAAPPPCPCPCPCPLPLLVNDAAALVPPLAVCTWWGPQPSRLALPVAAPALPLWWCPLAADAEGRARIAPGPEPVPAVKEAWLWPTPSSAPPLPLPPSGPCATVARRCWRAAAPELCSASHTPPPFLLAGTWCRGAGAEFKWGGVCVAPRAALACGQDSPCSWAHNLAAPLPPHLRQPAHLAAACLARLGSALRGLQVGELLGWRVPGRPRHQRLPKAGAQLRGVLSQPGQRGAHHARGGRQAQPGAAGAHEGVGVVGVDGWVRQGVMGQGVPWLRWTDGCTRGLMSQRVPWVKASDAHARMCAGVRSKEASSSGPAVGARSSKRLTTSCPNNRPSREHSH